MKTKRLFVVLAIMLFALPNTFAQKSNDKKEVPVVYLIILQNQNTYEI